MFLEFADKIMKSWRCGGVRQAARHDAVDVRFHLVSGVFAQHWCILYPKNAMDVRCSSGLVFNSPKVVCNLAKQWILFAFD